MMINNSININKTNNHIEHRGRELDPIFFIVLSDLL